VAVLKWGCAGWDHIRISLLTCHLWFHVSAGLSFLIFDSADICVLTWVDCVLSEHIEWFTILVSVALALCFHSISRRSGIIPF
jgi:hypothetical protein